MAEKHIAEDLHDLIDAERRVLKAVDDADANVGAMVHMAACEEMKRAREALRAATFALNRLWSIAERSPQKKKS